MIKDGFNEPRRGSPKRHRIAPRTRRASERDGRHPNPLPDDNLACFKEAQLTYLINDEAYKTAPTPENRQQLANALTRLKIAEYNLFGKRRPRGPEIDGGIPATPDRPKGSSGGAAAALDFDAP